MIEKTVKTTKGKLRVKMPTRLDEIKLGQIMEMQEKPNLNDLDAISILSEIPILELQNILNLADLQVFGNCVLSLSEQLKYLYDNDTIPREVTFTSDKHRTTVSVLNNLVVEPVGAFMAASEAIADEISEFINQHGEEGWRDRFNPSLKTCCQVLAHYFFCKATGKKYNEYEAEDFCNTVKKLRVTEALPIAKHFFYCYPDLSKRKTSCFRRFRQYWRKRLEYRLLRSLST